MRILLLEDIPEMAAATIVAIGRAFGDVTVEHRLTVEEAIGYLVTRPSVDLVIIDHNTLRDVGPKPLRTFRMWTSAKIVAFTGHEVDSPTVVDAKYDGAAHKPLIQDLIAEIRRVLT